jgi:probable F420-dependent oxidoreductase
MKVAVGLMGVEQLLGGDIARIAEFARLCEARGVDQLSAVDHVIMSEATGKYPYGTFPSGMAQPWYEPLTLLAAIASATRSIRLSTGILITPLRPAVFLAKQVATLDRLSRGRVDLGVGVGWQEEEYIASGVPWEGRFGYMMEQLEVCKALWTRAPVTHHGKSLRFDNMHSMPQPVQQHGVPLWFGVAPSPRNIERMGRLGDGWLPMMDDAAVLADAIARIKASMAEHGRDPSTFAVRLTLRGKSIDEVLARVPALAKIGVTMVSLIPTAFGVTEGELERVLDRLVACKAAS